MPNPLFQPNLQMTLGDPSQAQSVPPLAQIQQTPEQFQQRRAGWFEYLNNPSTRAALMQFGINMLSGSPFGPAVGSAAQAAGNAARLGAQYQQQQSRNAQSASQEARRQMESDREYQLKLRTEQFRESQALKKGAGGGGAGTGAGSLSEKDVKDLADKIYKEQSGQIDVNGNPVPASYADAYAQAQKEIQMIQARRNGLPEQLDIPANQAEATHIFNSFAQSPDAGKKALDQFYASRTYQAPRQSEPTPPPPLSAEQKPLVQKRSASVKKSTTLGSDLAPKGPGILPFIPGTIPPLNSNDPNDRELMKLLGITP